MTTSRTLATAAAGLAAATVAASFPAMASAAPSTAAAADGGLGRYYSQHLAWKACTLGPDDEVGRSLDEAGARCADVTVPLDYARPEGRTITIAISRLAASDRAHRIGTMLINGGGPGPSIDMPPYIRDLMGKAGPRYDLIGMDPRSLGRSAPVDCHWPSATWVRSAGETRRSFRRSVAFAEDLAARCAKTDGAELPYISTRNIARDMDVVRGALGERKISYNGASYGTYLGSVYATMFPGRLDRTVLDSSVDPRRWGPGLLAGTEGANDRALAHWAGWTAKRNATYGLGATPAEVLATVRDVVRASAREPLQVGRYRVDDTALAFVPFDLLGTDEDSQRAALADAIRVFKKATAGPVEPTKDLDEELAFLLTGAESRYGSGQSAIICGDAATSRDPETYWRAVQSHRKQSPVFGPLAYGINPCAFWPVRPREPLTEVGGPLPALMVAATGDTRTVYPGSLALHRLLPGSRMITLKGADVHAPYQRGYKNDCVTGQVNDYLLTGRLTARDRTCTPQN
ncbi:Tripeptidyl aminopeptidase [Actinomadura sp. RB99]|uniref:alpha/beta hydrolase n=1 Tax=Actinomadura sp. RB99 TaxID=2691577 RepID=UPI001686DB1A|nr:alpha/beta hydrolase [Actinomadura sp. RB99]MBD2893851.1 Tripeptidyl aminopeptidase [Actinomadura sp. RB99]